MLTRSVGGINVRAGCPYFAGGPVIHPVLTGKVNQISGPFVGITLLEVTPNEADKVEQRIWRRVEAPGRWHSYGTVQLLPIAPEQSFM